MPHPALHPSLTLPEGKGGALVYWILHSSPFFLHFHSHQLSVRNELIGSPSEKRSPSAQSLKA